MAIIEGKRVEITASWELNELKLKDLVGRMGVVYQDLTQPTRRNKGYMVRLAGGSYQDEAEWFIPEVSVKEIRQ